MGGTKKREFLTRLLVQQTQKLRASIVTVPLLIDDVIDELSLASAESSNTSTFPTSMVTF